MRMCVIILMILPFICVCFSVTETKFLTDEYLSYQIELNVTILIKKELMLQLVEFSSLLIYYRLSRRTSQIT